MDLIVTRWIAIEGAVILERDWKEKLCRHFPKALVDAVEELAPLQKLAESDVRACREAGAELIQPLGEGGIFTGLWLMAEELGCGLEADLRKIPVRQELIEICELFDLNPYNMLSGGSLLVAAQNGLALMQMLGKEGIPSAWIGRTKPGNDRIIQNQGHIRYLDRPQREELYRIYQEGWKPL